MKKLLISCLSAAFIFNAAAQITTNELPLGLSGEYAKDAYKTQTIGKEALPDMQKIVAEDSENDADMSATPLRFAYPVQVKYSPETSGSWQTLPNGDKLWTLDIIVPGALSTHALYDKFWIPEGGKFFVYSRETGQSIGAITSEFLEGSADAPEKFATALVYGENVTFEYYQPSWVKESAVISISRIDYGYRYVTNPYQIEPGDYGDSCPNQVNVNCSEGNNWQNEKGAVARILIISIEGAFWGSGALINNVNNDRTPYFLTANHNLKEFDAVSNPNVSQWIFYWNYESSGCTNGQTYEKQTVGATVIANDSPTDFALLRLTQSPMDIVPIIKPYFLGWDRSGSSGTGGVGIHHPRGDIKKIATYTMTPVDATCVGSGYSNANFWKVSWVQTANGFGVQQPGSSGSPLINSSRRITGQLLGRGDCTEYQCVNQSLQVVNYGKFSVSWTNSSNIYRQLKNWLATSTNNPVTLNGLDDCTPNAPSITTITGPSSATSATPAVYYEYVAGPSFSAAVGTYEWSTVPATSILAPNGNTLLVAFTAPGSYAVRCRGVNRCGTAYSGYTIKNVLVTAARSYDVSLGTSSKIFVVTEIDSDGNSLQSAGSVAYSLLNQTTGAVAAAGQIAAQGGTLDFSNLPVGIYILQIHVSDELIDTHRILLK
jgi:hypothetical protein